MYRVLKAVKLQYSDIPKQGLRFDIRGEDGRWEGLKDFSVEVQPRGHLFVQRQGRDVFVRGEVCSTLRFECSRCLEGFSYQVQTTLSQLLRPREDRAEAKEIELAPDDLEMRHIRRRGYSCWTESSRSTCCSPFPCGRSATRIARGFVPAVGGIGTAGSAAVRRVRRNYHLIL